MNESNPFTSDYRVTHNYLQPGLVPDSSVIEGSWGGEEKHDGNEGVQHHGQHEGDQVEQGDVREEHGNVHGGVTVQSEVTLGDHPEALDAAELDVGQEKPG